MFQQGLLVEYIPEMGLCNPPKLFIYDIFGNLVLAKSGYEIDSLGIGGVGHFRTIYINNYIISGRGINMVMTLNGDIIDLQGWSREWADPRFDVFAPGFPIHKDHSVKWLDEFGQPSDYPGLPSSTEDFNLMMENNRTIRKQRHLDRLSRQMSK